MSKNLEVNDLVVVSVAPDKKVEICKIICLPKEIIVVKYLSKKWTYGEFDSSTGVSVKGEEFGKLLQGDDLAIKEASEVDCPECGTPQINFFTAQEFLQGGKNFNCYNCKELLWLTVDGVVKEVAVEEPSQ